MKPRLPYKLEAKLPDDILIHIYSFVPHLPKPKKQSSICSVSPNMERNIRAIQSNSLKGKNEMYLRDLDDFILH